MTIEPQPIDWSAPPYPAILRGAVVTMGNFDGVHLGHAALVKSTVALARQIGIRSIALTFSPPPLKLLKPGLPLHFLTTSSQKTVLLKNAGIDHVCALGTNQDLLSLEPGDFFERVLCQGLETRGIVEGPDFHFGKNRAGGIQQLQKLCQQFGMNFQVAQPLQACGAPISSSRIRQLLLQGEVGLARELLGRSYSIEGVVAVGAKRGQTLGFPTANLEKVPTLIPGNGVYAAVASMEGKAALAAVNLGPNPTFGEKSQKVEVHILGFTGDLYGKELEVSFLEKIRGVVQFSSREALIQQILSDVESVKNCGKKTGIRDGGQSHE